MSLKNGISTKIRNFFDHFGADLVDQLTPHIVPVLGHMAPFLGPSKIFPLTKAPRESAVALIDALRETTDQGDQQLMLAFCCALVECGCCLAMLCRILADHLVDCFRLEQFARTKGTFSNANLWMSEEFMGMLTITETTDNPPGPAVNQNVFDLYRGEEEEYESDHPASVQLEFLHRHGELLRMKLAMPELVTALLVHWAVLQREHWEQIRLEKVELKNHCLVAILLTDGVKCAAHFFECICLALLLTRQFRLFLIMHERGNIRRMQILLQKFVENRQNQLMAINGTNGQDEDEEWTGQEEEPEGILSEGPKLVTVTDADLCSFYVGHEREIYPNFSVPRGRALVINNYHFHGHTTREGSLIDRQNMIQLLEQLGYSVSARDDLTKQEMLMAIRDFAEEPMHQWAHSAVVVAMSHGENDGLLGTDDQCLQLHEFVKALNSQNCRALAGKPKIFIIQACRGDYRDYGVLVPRAEEDTESVDGPLQRMKEWMTGESPKQRKRGPLSVFSRNNSPRNSLAATSPPPLPSEVARIVHNPPRIKWITEPTYADILIAQATTANYVSWRNASQGSWFVQDVCRIFRRWSAREDIYQMLTRVHRLVARRKTNNPQEHAKQVPELCGTLCKRFYFFPGLKEAPPSWQATQAKQVQVVQPQNNSPIL